MHINNKTIDNDYLINYITREYFNLKYTLPFISKKEGLRAHRSLKGFVNRIKCLEERATWLQKLDAEKIKIDLKIS